MDRAIERGAAQLDARHNQGVIQNQLEALRNRGMTEPDSASKHELMQPWPKPQALVAKVEAEPYPLDALPRRVRAAIMEVAGFTKAPIPLIASSALAAISLVIQPHADIKRADRLTGPTSLNLLTIADSGERKSTVDSFFMLPIRKYQEEQAKAARSRMKDYTSRMEAWDAKRSGIKDKIRQHAKDGKLTEGLERELRQLEYGKPEQPQIPRLLYADVTPEALAQGLARWSYAGLISAEAGTVFGAHAMSRDTIMRNLAQLNVLWDGGSLVIDRKSTESFSVRNVRLTVGLQVQEIVLRDFLHHAGQLARGIGFLARYLVAFPQSTQGSRPFTEPPKDWPALADFNHRSGEFLTMDLRLDDNGALNPVMLEFTPDAKRDWVAVHDQIESQLAIGGELYDVRDVASKTADNVARIAALLSVFEHGFVPVGIDAVDAASRIAAWHLNESRRFFGELSYPAELANACRLDAWLIEYCERHEVDRVPVSIVQQRGPAALRRKVVLDPAIHELVGKDRVRTMKDGSQSAILLNPGIVKGGGGK